MGSERRRGSVRPRYKAGILGMAMLPPSPSLLSCPSLFYPPLGSMRRAWKESQLPSAPRELESSIDKPGTGGQPFTHVRVRRRFLL